MSGFPLLLIPLAICNIIVFLMPGVAFDTRLFALPLMSGALWTVTLSDALIALGLLLLMLEMLRSARAGGKYITDHLLALVIFGGAAAEFLLLPQFANATFFLLTLIALVDFLSGLGLRRRSRRVVETVVAEPVRTEPVRIDPVRAEPVRADVLRPETVRAEPVRVEPVHEAPAYKPAPASTPASVIVPPPPAPEPLLPKPETVARTEPAADAPTIDVTPNDAHDRPPRPANS